MFTPGKLTSSLLNTLTAKPEKEGKKEKKKVSLLGVRVVQWWTPPVSSLHPLSLFPLLSLLWAVIDLISSSLNWSHDSCCSDWPSLTTHRHSSVMPSPIYLSICLCLLSLTLPSGESTCCPHRATMARFAPVCHYYYVIILHHYHCLLSLCENLVLRHLSVNLLEGFYDLNQHSTTTVLMYWLQLNVKLKF